MEGGCFLALMAERDLPPPRPVARDPSTRVQTSLLHYALRSTVVLHREAEQSTVDTFRRWSRLCLRVSQKYARDYPPDATLAPPEWASLFDDAIKSALRARFPAVDDVCVQATLEPRLYARSFPQSRQIHVSALTREYLRTFSHPPGRRRRDPPGEGTVRPDRR